MNRCYLGENPFFKIKEEENSVIAYSTARLSFEPKGWQKEFKEKLREAISHLHANDGSTLLAKYGSTRSNDFVDVENALFYNIGPSVFQHLATHSILFENLDRAETSILLAGLHCSDSYFYYYEYNVVTISNSDELWWQSDLAAEWMDIKMHKPHTDQKPLDYWRVLKMNPDAITIHASDIIDGLFGMDIKIIVPQYAHINLAAIMKPLLDGVICAFHIYKDFQDSNIEKMCSRLECTTDMLTNASYGILGKEIYIRNYRNGIKWNPQDDRCNAIRLSTSYSKTDSWSFSGKIYRFPSVT